MHANATSTTTAKNVRLSLLKHHLNVEFSPLHAFEQPKPDHTSDAQKRCHSIMTVFIDFFASLATPAPYPTIRYASRIPLSARGADRSLKAPTRPTPAGAKHL
jgi:hypothetical protein